MEFFIPFAENDEVRDHTYDAIKKHLGQAAGAAFSGRRIQRLQWRHDGKEYRAEVGKETAFNGEPVIAILYEPLRDLYHVCTPSRGVVRGISILAGANSVSGSTDFDR